MNKLILIVLVILPVIACKKTEYSPIGPTDIRVRNLSDITLNEVIVNTSDTLGDVGFGNIGPGSQSEYILFEKAYPKATISAKIGDITYTTGPVDYTYMTVLGQGKFTYTIYILTDNPPRLKINEVIPDAPLD